MNPIIFAFFAFLACANASALNGPAPSAIYKAAAPVYQTPVVHLQPIVLPSKAIVSGYQAPGVLVPASSHPIAAATANSADVGLSSGAYSVLAVPSWNILSRDPIVAEPIRITHGTSYPTRTY